MEFNPNFFYQYTSIEFQKIENSVKNARLDTILKVFDALGAKVNFIVVLNNKKIAY